MPGQSLPSQQLYGTLGEDVRKQGISHLSLLGLHGRPIGIDFFKVFLFAIVPAAVFALTSLALSFHLHYTSAPLAWLLAILCLLATVTGAIIVCGPPSRSTLQGRWLVFFYGAVFSMWLLAIVIGNVNYSSNMKPFYDSTGLNFAPAVDPSASGQGDLDAGRMMFLPGSILDTRMAMGVKVGKTYCVAPVVNPGVTAAQRQYDFWAVGEDCCSSVEPSKIFNCATTTSGALSRGGMRLMEDNGRPFFRMAVQEAEATYKIRAKHPIFLHWMEDPNAELARWRDKAARMFYCSILSVSVFMLFSSFSIGLYLARYHSDDGLESSEARFFSFRDGIADRARNDDGQSESTSAKSAMSLVA